MMRIRLRNYKINLNTCATFALSKPELSVNAKLKIYFHHCRNHIQQIKFSRNPSKVKSRYVVKFLEVGVLSGPLTGNFRWPKKLSRPDQKIKFPHFLEVGPWWPEEYEARWPGSHVRWPQANRLVPALLSCSLSVNEPLHLQGSADLSPPVLCAVGPRAPLGRALS